MRFSQPAPPVAASQQPAWWVLLACTLQAPRAVLPRSPHPPLPAPRRLALGPAPASTMAPCPQASFLSQGSQPATGQPAPGLSRGSAWGSQHLLTFSQLGKLQLASFILRPLASVTTRLALCDLQAAGPWALACRRASPPKVTAFSCRFGRPSWGRNVNPSLLSLRCHAFSLAASNTMNPPCAAPVWPCHVTPRLASLSVQGPRPHPRTSPSRRAAMLPIRPRAHRHTCPSPQAVRAPTSPSPHPSPRALSVPARSFRPRQASAAAAWGSCGRAARRARPRRAQQAAWAPPYPLPSTRRGLRL